MSTTSQHLSHRLRSVSPHCHRVPRMWAAPGSMVWALMITGLVLGTLDVIGFIAVIHWWQGLWQ